jgi:hypothetical protein
VNTNQDSAPALEPNDVARRYCVKPGFKLIDYLQIALPVFVIPIEAIVISAKPLALVDEFILRSISEGINTLPDLGGFLGLDNLFVQKRLAQLIAEDVVAYGPTGGSPATARMTSKGQDALKKAMVIAPTRASFMLAIDGITRQPLATKRGSLIQGVDARAYGYTEIRAFPQDKAPEFEELAAMDLTAAVLKNNRKDKNIEKVMSLVHVGTRRRKYQEATMLIFRAERGAEIHVEFFVDGRPHKQVTESFARYDGVKSLHIQEQVQQSLRQTLSQLETIVPEVLTDQKSREVDATRVALQPFVARVGHLESKIEEKEIAIEEAGSHAEIQQLRKQVEQLQAEKAKAELELNSIDVRHLEVHEHRPLFMRSLEIAKQRLLIISPWINDHVLNNIRLQKIRALVDAGVEVYIGYGIGEDPNHKRPGKNRGEQAIKYLSELAKKNPNLHFKDLGDTHAKILLVDDKYAVAGSFNWLSFEGDPRKGFREEMSLQLNLKPQIEDLFQYYKETRF